MCISRFQKVYKHAKIRAASQAIKFAATCPVERSFDVYLQDKTIAPRRMLSVHENPSSLARRAGILWPARSSSPALSPLILGLLCNSRDAAPFP